MWGLFFEGGGAANWRWGFKGLCRCALRLCKLLSTVKILLFLFYCLTFSVTSKAPKFTKTFASELDLDKGYFDRIYRTFLLWLG